LIVLSIIKGLSKFEGLSKSGHILAELIDSFFADFLRKIDQFSLKLFEIENAIKITVISSSLT
jgi:hypothetical protein